MYFKFLHVLVKYSNVILETGLNGVWTHNSVRNGKKTK